MVSPHGAPQTGQDRYGESSRSASNRAGSIWLVLTERLKQGRIDMVSPHGAPQTGQDRYGESSRMTSNRAGSIW